MNLDEILSTLESPIVIRPTRRMTQGELESYLDHAAISIKASSEKRSSLPRMRSEIRG